MACCAPPSTMRRSLLMHASMRMCIVTAIATAPLANGSASSAASGSAPSEGVSEYPACPDDAGPHVHALEQALEKELGLPERAWCNLAPRAARGDTHASLRAVYDAVNADRRINGKKPKMDLSTWGELLDAYGFFENGTTKRNQIRDTARLYTNVARGWGTFFMAWDLVKSKKARKMKAVGLPLNLQAYRASLNAADGAHAFGMFNMTLHDIISDAISKGAPESYLDSAYLRAVVETATSGATRVIRSVISVVDETTMRWIEGTCGATGLQTTSMSYSVTEANKLTVQCLASQGIFDSVMTRHKRMQAAGTAAEEDGKSWGPVHAASRFGDKGLMKLVLDLNMVKPSDFVVSPLTIAGASGWPHITKMLLDSGFDLNVADRWGRTALDQACVQRWSPAELTATFGEDLYRACSETGRLEPLQPAAPFTFTGPGGGWGSTSAADSEAPFCDMDVVEGLTAEDFLHDYVSIRKPVLARGILVGQQWDDLRQQFARDTIADAHPDLEFETSNIPYGETFGIKQDRVKMGIARYTEYMRSGTAAGGGGSADAVPRYIFASMTTSVAKNATLHASMLKPSIVDQQAMSKFGAQFYLGSPGTGAPVHFHTDAVNILIHGRKRWVMLPPRHALYSKEHITKWRATELEALKAKGHTMECVQEPGDVLYVPTGWGHGVLNLAESVGYALEFDWGVTEVKQRRKTKTGSKEPPANVPDIATLQGMRIKHLRKILKDQFGDRCKECKEKSEFVERIVDYAQKRAAASADRDEL